MTGKRPNHSSPDLRKVLARIAIEQDRRLNRAAVSVASALISHANLETNRCDPGIERLVRETGYSQQTVSKTLNQLIDCGWLERIRHGGERHTNKYLINWNALVAAGMDWEIEAGLRQPATPVAGGDGQPTTRGVGGSVGGGVTDGQPTTPVVATYNSSCENLQPEAYQNLEGNPEKNLEGKKGFSKNGFGVSEATSLPSQHHPNAPQPQHKRLIKEATRGTNPNRRPQSKHVARNKAEGELESQLTQAGIYDRALSDLPSDVWNKAVTEQMNRKSGLAVVRDAMGVA